MSESWTTKRARVAALSRGVRAGERTQAELDDARRDLKAVRLADHVAKALSTAPTLTPDQLGRVAAILHGGGA